VRDEVLLGEARGIDGLDAGQIGEFALVTGSGGGERVVTELVVVTVVSDGSGLGGIHLEAGLPGVFKEGVLGGKARGYGGGRLASGELRNCGKEDSRGGDQVKTHAEKGSRAAGIAGGKVQAAGLGRGGRGVLQSRNVSFAPLDDGARNRAELWCIHRFL